MTRTDHLLVCLAEECNEVAQRAAKALRFGLEETQQGQELSNAERIKVEFLDLFAVWGMLCASGVCQPIGRADQRSIEAKQAKVEKYLDYSEQQGRLTYSSGR